MALLVTSCTMGKNPNRLLDKGPSYLRTRTNSKLFAGRRRSAVELLEASKPQYVKSNDVLDSQRPISLHLPDSFDVFARCEPCMRSTPPSTWSRSKSEYKLNDLPDGIEDKVDGIIKPPLKPKPVLKNSPIAGDTKPTIKAKTVSIVTKTSPITCDSKPTIKPKPILVSPKLKPVPVELQQTAQQQQNLLGCSSSRRTPSKAGEAGQIGINMSEEGNNTATSLDHKSIDCIKTNSSGPPGVGKSNNAELSNMSVSCQSLGQTTVDKTVERSSEVTSTTGALGVTSSAVTANTCTLVHRSHSDLNCRHPRDSSATSDRSGRYSRASADLENFFNQMGLERNVLDPMLKRQEGRRELDMFESVSSLDSPDTRSICSGISKSEKGYSDTEGDKSPHNTNVVERNARIIKWLCSVKKAKTNLPGHS